MANVIITVQQIIDNSEIDITASQSGVVSIEIQDIENIESVFKPSREEGSIGYFLQNNEKLQNFVIDLSPTTISEKTINLNKAFENCDNLKNPPTFNSCIITGLQETFNSCSILIETVDMSTNIVKCDYNHTYSNCVSLLTLNGNFLPNNKVDSEINGLQYCFYNCENLDFTGHENFDNLFLNPRIKNFDSTFANCKRLSRCPVLNYAEILNTTFENCYNFTGEFFCVSDSHSLSEIKENPQLLPNSVISMNGTFKNCYKLGINTGTEEEPEIYLPNLQNISSTTLFATFDGCKFTEYKILDKNEQEISQLFSNTIIDMSCCFRNNTSLIKIPKLPNGIKNLSNCFENDTSLTHAELLSQTERNISEEVEYPENVRKYIDTLDSLENINGIFNGCSNLQKVYGITENVTNMDCAFKDCVNLKKILFIKFYMSNIDSASNVFTNSGINEIDAQIIHVMEAPIPGGIPLYGGLDVDDATVHNEVIRTFEKEPKTFEFREKNGLFVDGEFPIKTRGSKYMRYYYIPSEGIWQMGKDTVNDVIVHWITNERKYDGQIQVIKENVVKGLNAQALVHVPIYGSFKELIYFDGRNIDLGYYTLDNGEKTITLKNHPDDYYIGHIMTKNEKNNQVILEEPIKIEELNDGKEHEIRINVLTNSWIDFNKENYVNKDSFIEMPVSMIDKFSPDRIYINPDGGYPLPPRLENNIVENKENEAFYKRQMYYNSFNKKVIMCDKDGFVYSNSYTNKEIIKTPIKTKEQAFDANKANLRDLREPIYKSCAKWFEDKYYTEENCYSPFTQKVRFSTIYNKKKHNYKNLVYTFEYDKSGESLVERKITDDKYFIINEEERNVLNNNEIISNKDYINFAKGTLNFAIQKNSIFGYSSKDSLNKFGIFAENTLKTKETLKFEQYSWLVSNFYTTYVKSDSVVKITEMGLFNKNNELIAYSTFPTIEYDSNKHHLSIVSLIDLSEE